MKFYCIPIVVSLIYPAVYSYTQSQTRTLTGTVKSFEESFPLEGVSVSVKGTKNITGTQADGVYYINVTAEDSILLFSAPGYQSQEIKITNNREYNVILKAANNSSFTRTANPYPLYASRVHRCRTAL